MDMISKLNAEDETSATGKKNKTANADSGLINLKNTLFAIEKLNDATFVAEALGQPVNYTQVMQNATRLNSKSTVSPGSSNILKEFDNLEEQFTAPQQNSLEDDEIQAALPAFPKGKLKPTKKKTKNKQKESVRRRRHDDDKSRIRILSYEEMRSIRDKIRSPRVSAKQQNGKLALPGDRDDEFLGESGEHLVPAVGRGHRFQADEDSEEDDISPEIKLPNVYIGQRKPVQQQSKPMRRPQSNVADSSSKKKVQVLHSEQEDDEFNSPESEEVTTAAVQVPGLTFSQTFIDTLGTPSLHKPKRKPVHKVVKVKPQALRATTIKPSSTTAYTKRPSKITTSLPKLRQKYSGESEDDEEDAMNTEKKIDVLVSKYKPREKSH